MALTQPEIVEALLAHVIARVRELKPWLEGARVLSRPRRQRGGAPE